MDKKHFQDLVRNFFSGHATESERCELEDLVGDKMNADFDSVCQEIWKEDQEIDENKIQQMTGDILSAIRTQEEKRKSHRRLWIALSSTAAVAACLLVAVLVGNQKDRNTEIYRYEQLCESGKKSVLTLPDGSIVHLNSSSKIAYSSEYNQKIREVELSGEAFFEVAHDAKRPFVVRAGDVSVRVLGTKFNVKAYEDDNLIETTLVEGKVMADLAGNEAMMLPKERISYDKTTGRIDKETILDEDRLVPWMQNKIFFQHDTMEKIGKILERTYGVKVIIEEEEVRNYSFTGHISNSSLKTILDVIAASSSLSYTISGDTIRIYKKQ